VKALAAIPAAVIEIDGIAEVMLAMSTLLAVASVLAVITRRLRIPLTLLLVAVGFAAGEIARANGVELPIEGETFHDVLLFAFLPVLVFEAALTLPARVFLKNLVPVLTLAVVALAIAAGLVGLMVHIGLGVSLTAALLFGALISATDPVAVTQTFRDLGVPNRLLVLVEGESLLNDGIAIVLFQILLVAALGTEQVGVLSGVVDFVYVFFGGAALGGALGLGVAEVAARLGRLPSTALTVAVAYGSFALGENIFGFSGVMASVSTGLVLALLSRTLIPKPVVETWHAVWHSVAFVANGILFLLIGIVIEASMIADNLDAIAVGIGAVVISRPLAIFPVMPVVTRLARIPAVGLRNQAVLVWGGLRGGVALALALGIPQSLPEQERFVAMTAGVVLATLILNATTIGPLVRYLGLDKPDRLGRWVAAAARFDGAHAAREELHASVANADIEGRLGEVEEAAVVELDDLALTFDEHFEALLRRGLAVERQSFQGLVDESLLPQWHGRVALNALEDQLEELIMGRIADRGLFETRGLARIVYAIARRIHEGSLTSDRWVEIAYRDLSARARASGDAIEAIEVLGRCPSVPDQALARVAERFRGYHYKALQDLERLGDATPQDLFVAAQRHYAADLGRLASSRELRHLSALGLVSTVAVEHAAEQIAVYLEACERDRFTLAVDAEEDIGT
jgi:monovalent cation:H+ antiporter, CPA1 family